MHTLDGWSNVSSAVAAVSGPMGAGGAGGINLGAHGEEGAALLGAVVVPPLAIRVGNALLDTVVHRALNLHIQNVTAAKAY